MKIGILVAAALVLGGGMAGAVPLRVDYGSVFPASSEDFERYAPGTLGLGGPFDFEGFSFEAPGFDVSISDRSPCGATNRCLGVGPGSFGDIVPSSTFSGFQPGTRSFGVRTRPGEFSGFVAASATGLDGTSAFFLIPDGDGGFGFRDPAGLLSVTVSGPGYFDDVVTGIAQVPLPPAGLALLAGLGGLLVLRRRTIARG